MYTLDANIFVRDANPRDPDHADCRALLDRLHAAGLRIIMPTIVLAEVAGPLSRAYRDAIRARLYAERLAALAHVTLVVLDGPLAQAAANIAADYALCGMDAIYVAVRAIALENGPKSVFVSPVRVRKWVSFGECSPLCFT